MNATTTLRGRRAHFSNLHAFRHVPEESPDRGCIVQLSTSTPTRVQAENLWHKWYYYMTLLRKAHERKLHGARSSDDFASGAAGRNERPFVSVVGPKSNHGFLKVRIRPRESNSGPKSAKYQRSATFCPLASRYASEPAPATSENNHTIAAVYSDELARDRGFAPGAMLVTRVRPENQIKETPTIWHAVLQLRQATSVPSPESHRSKFQGSKSASQNPNIIEPIYFPEP